MLSTELKYELDVRAKGGGSHGTLSHGDRYLDEVDWPLLASR